MKKIMCISLLLIINHYNIAMESKEHKINEEIEESIRQLITKPSEHKKRKLIKMHSDTFLTKKDSSEKTHLVRTISAPVLTKSEKYKRLIRAVKDQNQIDVKKYVCKEIVNRADTAQRTPLMWATTCYNGAKGSLGTIVNLLLEMGADPNRTNMNGNTALHIALLQNNINPGIIQLLIDAGTRLYLPNNSGKTVLNLIKSKKKKEPVLNKIILK